MAMRTFDSFTKSFKKNGSVNRLLVTGASGRLGTAIFPFLKQIYGVDNILLTDIKNDKGITDKHFKKVDVRDASSFEKAAKDFKADTVLHLATIEATKGEKDPQNCLEVNTSGTLNAIELAKSNKLKLFYASSLDTFCYDTPRRNAPSLTFQRPTTMAGVSGTYMELFGSYYHYKYNTDFRCLRFSNIIAPVQANNGVFKEATQIYYEAVGKGKFQSHLKPETFLPSLHIEDAAIGLIQILEANPQNLRQRIYNIGSCTFTAAQQADSIKKLIPNFKVEYKTGNEEVPPEQFPQSIDDFEARNDFNYQPQYDLTSITSYMIDRIKKKH